MDQQETSSAAVVVPNVKKFTPSGERLKSHGNLYHCQQLMFFLCKSVGSGNVSFEVTCEVEEANKFDDVVIFYKRNAKTLCRLIQIKHRENISKVLTFNDLTRNKDFKLKTYFDSYFKIKNDIKFEQKYECEIEELIICTNVDFDGDVKKLMKIVPDSIFNEYNLYRVMSSETEFMKKIIVGTDDAAREEFFSKLRFAVKQPDGEDLKDYIKHEIIEYLEKEHPGDSHTSERVETIYVTLLTKIIDFDTNKEVQVITDEGYLNWLHEAFSSGENQMSVYHRHNVCVSDMRQLRFKRESLEMLERFIARNDAFLLKVVACADTIFTIQKLVQIFNLQNREFRLIFDKQVAASMWNIKRDFLSTDRCEYLVVVCKSNETSKQVFKTIKDIHNKVKDSILNKQIVLVLNSEVKTENYSSIYDDLAEFEDHVKWDDFDEETKDYILKKQIVFQGQLVPFSAIDISCVRDSIKDRVLYDITFSDKYEIGKPFHDSKTDDMSYFVERNVHMYDIMRNPFDISNFGHLFAISHIDKVRFENFMSSIPSKDQSRYFRLNDETAEEELQKISCNNEDKNVSWIFFEDGTFRWKKSSLSIYIIKQYIETSFYRKIKLQTVSNINNKSVLVIGEPGMGKSTLLSSLATRSIEQSPDVWVIKIDLNNHTRYFFQLLTNSRTFSDEITAVEFITDTQKFCGFEKVLFESYFRIENKLVVLLDGFDEIAPHYKNIVVDLVKILKSADKITVWITSRPQEMVFLEEQLRELSYSLYEFTDEDQRQFFRKFWEKYVDKSDTRKDRLETFVDYLLKAISKSLFTAHDLLTSIPLQCKMLADVYNDAFIEFYENKTDDTGIPDVVDILDLYNRFIKIKCKINIEEKRGTDITKPENVRLLDKEIEELTSRYKLLCLGVVFEEDKRTLLTKESKKIIKTSLSDIENGIDKCGIVCSVNDGIPIFVHRTFAEYFAAMYLIDFIDNTKNERITFVRSKLFEPKYRVVRRFFDRLTGTDNIFKYALNGDKEQLRKTLENDPKEINLTDKFGRNVLHLIAGYDDTGDVCNYLVESGADTTRKDELFGLKPVEYAVALKVWGNVNVLIAGNENDKTILKSMKNKKNIMCIAGAKGWTQLIKHLVEIDKISVNAKDENKVSTLHFAVSQGHSETCRYLIGMGANVKNNFIVKYNSYVMYRHNINRYETPFHIAIKKGFVEIIKLFIENDRNIIRDICYKDTLLHSAIESANIEILRLLIDHGANVKSVNEYGETPLHIAGKDIDTDIIDLFLEHGASIEARNNWEYNLLMKYVQVGNISVARHLLAKGADIYYYTGENGVTALHLAASSGNLNLLEMFIAHDPNIVKKIGSSKTLLHEAMISNKIDMIESLIRYGGDVNGRNWNDETPLHVANENIGTEIVDILLIRGADIEATDRYGNTPLIKYVKARNLSVVRLLIEKGANIHHCPKNGLTVLHHAAFIDDLNMIEMLIANDPNIMNNIFFSETVLHVAVKSGRIKMIELLIRQGANVNGRNENDESPLHVVGWENTTKIISTLLSYGADIDATDRDGNTPLIKYAEENNLSVVRLLVAKGANIHHCSKSGLTVIHYAASNGFLYMLEMLIESGPSIMNDVNVTETVLHAAMKSNKIEIIELLIKHGANVHGKNENGEVPLHVATDYTDVKIIDILLNSGTNIDAIDYDGTTPLIKYTEAGNFNVVEHLIALGAVVHHRSADNRTALHRAVAVGNLRMVELFIRHDRTNVKTITSANTLLHEAMKSGNTEVIEILIDRRADVNGRNEKGEMPLHIADRHTSIPVIDTLLERGADVEARENDGETPIMKFEDSEYIEAVQLLPTFFDNIMKRSKKNKREAKKKKKIGCCNIF